MRLLGSLLLGLGTLGLVACGKGGIQSPDFTSELVSITVTPATDDVIAGETVTFTAVGNYTTPPGSDTPTTEKEVDVTWSSSNTSIATIDANGVATGVGNGTVTIRARAHGKEGTATLNAFAATLQSLVVSPDTATQPAGLPQQYTATGTFDTPPGSPTPTVTRDITTEVTWTVANAPGQGAQPVATIDATQGVATGLRIGSAVVTASLSGQSDTADFNVTAPILVELDVQPDDPSVPLGAAQTFSSVGVYSNGTTQPLQSTWVSSNPAVATVTPDLAATKEALTLTEGTTTITATYDVPGSPDDLVGSSVLTVTAPALVSFARIEPLLGRVTVGRQLEFTAIGEFSDGEHVIPDSEVTWSIANAAGGPVTPVASIDANGVAVGLEIGVAVVTATLNNPGIVTEGPSVRNARLTVTDAVCTTPLLASESATVAEELSLSCSFGNCSVTNEGNVIDADPATLGSISVALGLLGGNASIRVDAHDNLAYPLPFAAGNNAGFVVSKPAGTLVLAELFSQIQVSTLLGGVEKEQTDNINPLRVELLGQEVINGDLYDSALVSIATSNAYDSIRLTFNSGTATALSNVLVGQACGTLDLPPPASTLVRVARIVPQGPTLVVGSGLGLVAIGEFTDEEGGPVFEGPIADADLDWASVTPSVATVDANGLATGVTAGTAVIRARLKDGVVASTAGREATTEVTVLPSACETEFLASEGATAAGSQSLSCALCSVTDVPNAIDGSVSTAARIGVNLGLLFGTASITVTQDPDAELQAAGKPTGFLIGRPTGTVALAEVLSAIKVSVLRDGVVVFSSGPTIPLRLDLLGQQVVAMDDFGLVTITPTVKYDAISLTFDVGLLTVGLQNDVTNVNVYQACAVANVIAEAAGKKSMIPYRLH